MIFFDIVINILYYKTCYSMTLKSYLNFRKSDFQLWNIFIQFLSFYICLHYSFRKHTQCFFISQSNPILTTKQILIWTLLSQGNDSLQYNMLIHIFISFQKILLLPSYFQQILFYYIFPVGVGQNLAFGQKQFACQRVKKESNYH